MTAVLPIFDPVAVYDPSGARVATVTATDVLWLGRMVVGEAGVSATSAQIRALVSTIVRRWFQVDHLTGRARDLLGMVRAYSTPLQASRAGEARPAQIQALPWSALPLLVRDETLKIVRGFTPLTAPHAVHWAAAYLYEPHGLNTSSLEQRARTAPAAVLAREAARGNVGASYVPTGGPARDNVFSATTASRSLPDPVLGRSSQSRGGIGAAGGAGVVLAVLSLLSGRWGL